MTSTQGSSSFDPLFLSLLGLAPKKSDLTRIEMVKSTIECLKKNSVEDLTFEKIGAIMGVRHSHVSRYFPNKQELVEAAIKYILATWQTYVLHATEKKSAPLERLEASVTADFDWVKNEQAHNPVIGLLLYYSSLGGNFRTLFYEARKLGLSHLEQILGSCLPKATPKTLKSLSRDVQHLITEKALEYVCNPDGNNIDQLKKDTLRIIRILLKEQA